MAGTTPKTYKGNNAVIKIAANAKSLADLTHETLAISDFSLTFDKGTVEQELVGQNGNLFLAGSMSCEGSLTSCRVHTTGVVDILADMINGKTIEISGSCGTDSLHFYFKSCQVTGFDFNLGDADTVTEGSVDFAVLLPYKINKVTHVGAGGTVVRDFAT